MKNTGVYHCDNEQEKLQEIEDLQKNADFTYFGSFNSISSIYEEFNYQGLNDDEIMTMSNARYGACIEIIEFEGHYDVFFGQR